MDKASIVEAAVRSAQEIARKDGLTVGQLVAHPDIEAVGQILDIDGEAALVSFPNSVRELPLDELFDPRVAEREAVQAHVENLSRMN